MMEAALEAKFQELVLEAAEKDGPERKLHAERKHQERKNLDELQVVTEVQQMKEVHASMEATLAETRRSQADSLGIQRRLEEASARSEQYYVKHQDLEVRMESKVAALESQLASKGKHPL